MKYLLDTHILIWALICDEKLPEEVYRLINDPQNEIYYSTASVWEIAIKNEKKPERMPISGDQLVCFCERSDMVSLPITNQHVSALHTLARRKNAQPHNDPFDRMILAQAKPENMRLITHDRLFSQYDEPCVITV